MNQQKVFPSGKIARWIDTDLERDQPPEPGRAEDSSAAESFAARAGASLRYRPFSQLFLGRSPRMRSNHQA